MLYEVTVSRAVCEGSTGPVGSDNIGTLLNPTGNSKILELSEGCGSEMANDVKSNGMKFTKTERDTAKTRFVANFDIVTYGIINGNSLTYCRMAALKRRKFAAKRGSGL
jgi:hypothetical protein